MRTLEGSDRVGNGLKGILILLLVTAVGQTFVDVPMLFATPSYSAQFKDAGGLRSGDKVRIAGVEIGEVRDLKIEGDHILVDFTLGGRQIGQDSRADIRTDTILGRKNVEIEPRGSQPLRPNGVLPMGQTTTPYQIYDAFADLSKAASNWDLDTVKQSLNVLSEIVDQTYPQLSEALKGVERFSDTIGKRDDQIKQLLANASKIATILGNRGEDINTLLVNTQTLLAAINERSQAVTFLLERISAFSQQVSGFFDENQNLNKVLEQLRVISEVLKERKLDLVDALSNAAKIATGLGEAVSSGPYFKVMLVNLLPYQLLQPFVDAAFEKRGIDPEQFWRNAGLPAFQFPDPNGTRFPNGAPPPAPRVLEGTPEFPGPAVPKGSPCSYTPPADGLPSPANPLPCADLNVGPYGDNPYGPNYFDRPEVVTSPPDPNSPLPAPGIPIAGLPGEIPPLVPGTPVPLPPAPPGARSEPVGPVAGPTPLSSVPPAELPGPPPPPGPGVQLPPVGSPPFPGNPPFVPPDQVGGR